MARFVGLDVSQKLTALFVVDETGRRLWRGQCATDPGQIERVVRGHAGEDARIGVEIGPMTPWLVHELRGRGLDVTCLDTRHASAALKMQMNKTDQNDAEGLAQIMRTGWYRPVHMKSLDAHHARALLGARAQLVGMTTRLSNHIRGVLKTFGMLPGPMRGVPFDRRVEELLAGCVHIWGSGEVASADAIRFVAPSSAIHAAPYPKYFGAGRGITYYNLVSDQFTGLNAVVLPGTLRDSLVILGLLLGPGN